jgi:outer membrane protein TolC
MLGYDRAPSSLGAKLRRPPRAALAVALAVALCAGAARKSPADESLPLSLKDAVALAEKRNESLLMAIEDRTKAGAQVKEAYSGVLPNVELRADYRFNFTKPAFFAPEEFGGGKFEIGSDYEVTGQIRLDQTLYAFGRVGNAVEFAKVYKKITELGVADARSRVVFDAKRAYYTVLLAEEVAAIRRRSLEQARSHLRDIEQKFEQGTMSRFDLLRAQVEVKNREPELISAENDLSLAVQDLNRLLDIEPEVTPVLLDTLAYAPMEISEDRAVAEAFERRPEIKSLELNVEGRSRLLAIEKAGRLPTLDLYGQILYQGQADDDVLDPFRSRNRAVSTFAGISLTLPIFDGLRTKARIQQARADLRRSEHELEMARKAVSLEVLKAVKDLQSLKRSYEAQLATVSLAEETYLIAETRFKNGLSTQLELTDAETALDAARANYANTLFEYDLAIAALERTLGRTAGTGSEDTDGRMEEE